MQQLLYQQNAYAALDRLWAGATVERANALLIAGFWLLVVETLSRPAFAAGGEIMV